MACGPHLPLVDNGIWLDICRAWRADPRPFLAGCGQTTMAYYVNKHRSNSRASYSPRSIRRVLLAARRQGHVEYECRETCLFSVRIVDRTPLYEIGQVVHQYRFRLLAARPMRNSRAKKVLERVIITDSDYTAFTKSVRPGEILLSVECNPAS